MIGRLSNFFHSKRFFVALAILWAAVLAAVLLLGFQGSERSSWLSLKYPVAVQAAQPSGHGAYSYSVPMGVDLLSHNGSSQSPAQLYEDGQLLGPGNALHADIGTLGGGYFSFWKGNLIFSSSDHSDPRVNGRQYTLVLPLKYTLMAWGMIALLTITLVFDFRYYCSLPEIAKKRHLFYISITIVGIAFLIPRLPWFVDYPLPAILPDTYSYFKPARQIFSGQFPIFNIRTPGYPLFLTLSLIVFPYLKFTVVLQNLLTLYSALFFVWAAHKAYGKLVICAGITMVAHVAQPFIVSSDFSVLSESIYSSGLVLSVALLLLAICTQKARYAFMFSVVGGYTFWIRPSGIFLFGILLVVALYMILNSYPLKNVLYLVSPMSITLVLLLTYNYFTFGSFTVSNVNSLTLYGITSVYWEPDISFPAEVNQGIQKFKDEIPESDQYLLNTSWDPIKLQPIFANNAGKAIYLFDGDSALPLSDTARMALMRQIGSKAIKNHPEMALKCFWSTFFVFLNDATSWNVSFYGDIPWSIQRMYGTGKLAQNEFVAREYVAMPDFPGITVEGRRGEEVQVKVMPTPLLELQTQFTGILKRVFDMKLFLIGYFIVLLISTYMVIRSKLRDQGAFILFTVSSILLLAALTTALVSTMSNRYPSPTRFIEVFSIAFIPLFWIKAKESPAD